MKHTKLYVVARVAHPDGTYTPISDITVDRKAGTVKLPDDLVLQQGDNIQVAYDNRSGKPPMYEPAFIAPAPKPPVMSGKGQVHFGSGSPPWKGPDNAPLAEFSSEAMPWKITGRMNMLAQRKVIARAKTIEEANGKLAALKRDGWLHLSVSIR